MAIQKEKTIFINYVDKIDNIRVKHLIAIISTLIAKEKPDHLYFLISSQGGEVDAGIAFYNWLKCLPVKITMHNIGSIDSIANVIFAAGSKRYANPHSTFLFHGITITLNSPITFTLPIINELRDNIHKNHDKIAGIICENTAMDDKEIKSLFNQGETKDINFALKKGIIDKVKPAQIPKNALFISININN
jgi:ATP-dependent Clp protease protease subunit